MIATVATDETYVLAVPVGDQASAVVLLLVHPAVTVERLGEHRRHGDDRLRKHGDYCAGIIKRPGSSSSSDA
jgi:hypothetical protein